MTTMTTVYTDYWYRQIKQNHALVHELQAIRMLNIGVDNNKHNKPKPKFLNFLGRQCIKESFCGNSRPSLV